MTDYKKFLVENAHDYVKHTNEYYDLLFKLRAGDQSVSLPYMLNLRTVIEIYDLIKVYVASTEGAGNVLEEMDTDQLIESMQEEMFECYSCPGTWVIMKGFGFDLTGVCESCGATYTS